jgi:hypothetical protein
MSAHDGTYTDGETRGETRGNPFGRGTTKPDHEKASLRLPAGLLRRFDAWFDGQMAGLVPERRPSKDAYRAKAFELGVAHLEKALPPAESLDDRLAKALETSA